MSEKTKEIGRVAIVPKGTFNSSSTYTRLDVVSHDGASYMAKTDVPAGSSLTNATYWLQVAAKGSNADTATITSAVNAWLAAHVTQPTTSAIDNTLSITGAAADAAKTGLMTATVYSNAATYNVGDFVNYNGSLYKCTSAITTAEEWNSSHWVTTKIAEEVGELKSALIIDNNYNYLVEYPFNNTISNEVTFTRQEDGSVTVVGTVSGTSAYGYYFNASNRYPAFIQPGKRYHLDFSGAKVSFRLLVYKNGAWQDPFLATTKSTDFDVPADFVGFRIQLFVRGNGTVVNETVRPVLTTIKSDEQKRYERAAIDAASVDYVDGIAAELSSNVSDLRDSTDHFYFLPAYKNNDTTADGINYAWNNDKSACHIYGTATAPSLYTIVDKRSELPVGVTPGTKLTFIVSTNTPRIAYRVYWYKPGNTYDTSATFNFTRTFVVPVGCIGFIVRFYVANGSTVDGYASTPLIVNNKIQRVNTSWDKKPRYLVSFIDDDTSNDELVTRYYNAMKHNGIVGAYAVITKQYIEELNNIELLKAYQNDGFTMIPHCFTQQRYLDPRDATFNRASAIESYTKNLNNFRELGLNAPQNMWIIPYGRSDAVNGQIAMDMGFDLAFSTDWDDFIRFGYGDPYSLKRNGFSPLDAVTDDNDPTEYGTTAIIKRRLNDLMESPDGGWLIITTHFNTWGNIQWDSTLDANGYQIGYSRLNDLIQYIKASGAEIVSMAQGAAYYKPIIYRNKTVG